jgi:hypothetical protein
MENSGRTLKQEAVVIDAVGVISMLGICLSVEELSLARIVV